METPLIDALHSFASKFLFSIDGAGFTSTADHDTLSVWYLLFTPIGSSCSDRASDPNRVGPG